ncbi:MAG: hypothetical protein ACR2FH_05780 [Caulobacteraceae bacterium]
MHDNDVSVMAPCRRMAHDDRAMVVVMVMTMVVDAGRRDPRRERDGRRRDGDGQKSPRGAGHGCDPVT